MKAYLDPLKDSLATLTPRQFQYVLAGMLMTVFVIVGLLFYRFYGTVSVLQRDMKILNDRRREARVLISQNDEIQQQKAAAIEMLAKDGNFKLLESIGQLMQSLRLEQNVKSKNLMPGDGSLFKNSGYSEVQVEVTLGNLNTQQLVKLLEAVEDNQRLFIKKVNIAQPAQDGPLEVTITIASLQQRAETE